MKVATKLFAGLLGLAQEAFRDFAVQAAIAMADAALDELQAYTSTTRHAERKKTEAAPLGELLETRTSRGDAPSAGPSMIPACHRTLKVLLLMISVFFAGALTAYGVMRVILNRRAISSTRPARPDMTTQPADAANTEMRPTVETRTHTHVGVSDLPPLAPEMCVVARAADGDQAKRDSIEWSL
jgi:hypothetical protein